MVWKLNLTRIGRSSISFIDSIVSGWLYWLVILDQSPDLVSIGGGLFSGLSLFLLS